jgi:hypothetical protein
MDQRAGSRRIFSNVKVHSQRADLQKVFLHGFSLEQHSSMSRSIIGSKRELRLIENQAFVATTGDFPRNPIPSISGDVCDLW